MNTDAYKGRLEEEKKKLETELAGVSRKNPSNPGDWEPVPPPETEQEADPVDAADYSEGFDTNASITADLENRYNEVTAALARINEGTYGICEVSEEPIEADRLDADPAARTCKAHMTAA